MKIPTEMVMRVAPWAIPLLIIGTFIFDLLTPIGVAASVLYVIPLLLTFFSKNRWYPLFFCFIATALLWIDLVLKPASLLIEYSVLNRSLGMFVLWVLALGLFQLKRMQSELLNAEITRTKAIQDLMSERIERSHAEGLVEAAQEARAHAETAV